MRGLVLALGFLLVACGGDADTAGGPDVQETSAPEETPAEPEGPGPECVETDELTAVDNEWDPGCIVTSGSLSVTNEGETLHSFTIAGAVDVDIKSGANKTIDVTDATEPTGETFFQCKYHPGMSGFLWVQ